MNKIFCLAILLTVSLFSVESAQAKQEVFRACREGECLTWYLLNQTLIRQNSEPHSDRQLYQVEIDVDERFYRYERTPSPSRRPVLIQRRDKTVKWVKCSTQEPFVAEELEQQPDKLYVLYLDPASTRPGLSRYHYLYWAVCHNMWENQSQGIFLNDVVQLAPNFGYPTTLTYRSETVDRSAILGTSDR